MKRLKKVFSTSAEVAHVWASQSQNDGRLGGRGNIYFDGPSLYSYGNHYEVARIVKIKNETVVFINTSGYSNTTSKHIYDAKTATRHLTQIEFNDGRFDRGIRYALVQRQNELINGLMGVFNQINPWASAADFIKYTRGDFTRFNNTVEKFGYKELALSIPNNLARLVAAHINYRKQRDKELTPAREARKAQRHAEYTKELIARTELNNKLHHERIARDLALQANIPAWMTGADVELPRNVDTLIRIKGNEVQTSHNARVPLDEALTLLRDIKRGVNVISRRIGSYTVNEVFTKEVIIGCHSIDLAMASKVLSSARHLKLA